MTSIHVFVICATGRRKLQEQQGNTGDKTPLIPVLATVNCTSSPLTSSCDPITPKDNRGTGEQCTVACCTLGLFTWNNDWPRQSELRRNRSGPSGCKLLISCQAAWIRSPPAADMSNRLFLLIKCVNGGQAAGRSMARGFHRILGHEWRVSLRGRHTALRSVHLLPVVSRQWCYVMLSVTVWWWFGRVHAHTLTHTHTHTQTHTFHWLSWRFTQTVTAWLNPNPNPNLT